jgi:hypothetical protein
MSQRNDSIWSEESVAQLRDEFGAHYSDRTVLVPVPTASWAPT